MQRSNWMYFCFYRNIHICLAKYEKNSTSRLNLIDRIMQNKLTNTLLGSINIAMATVCMLF